MRDGHRLHGDDTTVPLLARGGAKKARLWTYPTLADAILDRLVHNAHRLNLTGESMRRKISSTKPLDQNVQD